MGPRSTRVVINATHSTADPTDPLLDQSSKRWSPDDHHHAEDFAVCASMKIDHPPLWSGLLSSTTRTAVLRGEQGHCLNCHEDSHPFTLRGHPPINASGFLNPDLDQLGDNGEAYQRTT